MQKRDEKLKQKLLGKLTHNLGEVVVEDDRIICYVDATKIDGILYLNEGQTNGILAGICVWPNYTVKPKYLEKYNLDKPIYFIYRNIDFYDRVWFSCPVEDHHIIFKNCRFENIIHIEGTKNVTFENNYYSLLSCNQPWLYADVENLKIINECFFGLGKSNSKFSINLKTKNLEIKDSSFNLDKRNSGITIKAKKVNIINSYIETYCGIEIDTNKLHLNNSFITSQTKIILNDKSNYNNIIEGLESPKTIYNGTNLSALKFIEDNNLDKQQLREILLQQLKQLKSEIEQTNIKEIIELNKRR